MITFNIAEEKTNEIKERNINFLKWNRDERTYKKEHQWTEGQTELPKDKYDWSLKEKMWKETEKIWSNNGYEFINLMKTITHRSEKLNKFKHKKHKENCTMANDSQMSQHQW